MALIIFTFLSALIIVALTVRPLITIALRKRLFDAPTESRKIHKKIIPNLGGLAVFTGFLLTVSLFVDNTKVPHLNSILGAGVIIYMIGLKDDIIGVDPLKKFVAQFTAAFIVSILGDVRIMTLDGFMGVYQLAYPLSIGLTVFTFVGLINAYNLIDGIDGLSGSMGVLMCATFGVLFYAAGDLQWAYIAAALAGALVGFLFHNISPARIFMGDCGSLLLGFMAAVFAVRFINLGASQDIALGPIHMYSVPALALAVVMLPVFDTLRVFALRMAAGNSPFKADRNHMHHRLLDLGLNHTKATFTLVAVSAAFITAAILLQDIGNGQLIATMGLGILALNGLVSIYLFRRKQLTEAAIAEAAGQNTELNLQALTAAPAQEVLDPEFAEKIIKQVSSKMDIRNN